MGPADPSPTFGPNPFARKVNGAAVAAAACVGLSVLLAFPVIGGAAGFELKLTVRESAGEARTGEPISGGVPLPPGRFKTGQPFALFQAGGKEIPCQVSPLVTGADGTLRWVLVDFQDDVAASGTSGYVLKAARPTARPAAALKVHDSDQAVTIDTGRVRLTVSRTRPFGVLAGVSVGGRPVVTGGELACTRLTGRSGWDDPARWQERTFRAGVPGSVKLLYAGPLRVTVEAAGRFEADPAKAAYQAWLTAWAGSARVRVKLKICNSNPDRYTALCIRRATLSLDLAGRTGRALIGAGKCLSAAGGGWVHQGLRGGYAGSARAGSGREVLWTRAGRQDPPAGWIAAGGEGPSGGVFACDVLFSSNPARRLAVAGGKLILSPVAERFEGVKDAKGRSHGLPWRGQGAWLYDCSHHSSEYLLDFAAPAAPAALNALARSARNRLLALAPAGHYSDCEALATGRFGSLADEIACYRKWGWTFQPRQLPRRAAPVPGAFVRGEDNHYESEGDSVQGLLLMYLRTGQRGFFDLGSAWARYHMDLQAWRTDGWRWKDGAVWFPQGGPQGNRRVRKKYAFRWGPGWGKRQGDPDCADLWRHAVAKSCYCHFYGSGLVDYYCLTGDRDALAAAADLVETKAAEFERFKPGTSRVGSIRGFGRGFEVVMRYLQADPHNESVRKLAHLAARTLWRSPLTDERGFHCERIGGLTVKQLSPNVLKWMKDRGIRLTEKRGRVESLAKAGRTWRPRKFGGTWMHVYVQNGADLYARLYDDEDMRDFTIAFAQMAAKYMLSPKCHQTWYYAYFDVPDLGMVFDPWAFDHVDTTDGAGCVHSGWYTRFFPDACAKGYSLTGERHLLEKAREFWYYGSKRRYRSKSLTGGPNEVGKFAGHIPPKDDETLSTGRLFYESAHPRSDDRPPAAIRDLRVRRLGEGRAELRFTAPADAGGGRVARYQVKAATMPILPYEKWDYARDLGRKRNWWRAVNCRGEPAPSKPGSAERFVVTGVPAGQGEKLHFAVRSFDDSNNRSAVSNLASP